MLKSYQFKLRLRVAFISLKRKYHFARTHDRIIRRTPLRVQNQVQVQVQMHPWMLVETTRVIEFEILNT